MASELRFGVIGCGDTAMETCVGISAAANASLTLLMDTRPEVLAELAMIYAAATTTDLDEALQHADVDAVYIATPPALHAAQGIRAAQAGKHILLETPLATTLAEADELSAACRANGVQLGLIGTAQVDAGIAAARNLLRAGILGPVIAVRITGLDDRTARDYGDWRGDKAQAGGGVLLNRLTNDLNTVRWATGLEAVRVYAEYGAPALGLEVEDTAGALIRYDNGAIGVLQAGAAMRGGAYEDLPGPRVYATKGQVILNSKPMIYWTDPPEGGKPNTWQALRFSGPSADRAQMVWRFAEAVLQGHEPPIRAEDGRKALEIVLAAYRAGETGQPVTLPLA